MQRSPFWVTNILCAHQEACDYCPIVPEHGPLQGFLAADCGRHGLPRNRSRDSTDDHATVARFSLVVTLAAISGDSACR